VIRHVVLIAIDCLRADHVSCFGYARPTTPTIDALAAEGVVWRNAHSACSWTKPAVASLLTGLYPSQHGAFQGIKRSKLRPIVTTDILATTQPTLAETFSSGGWRCGAFINNSQLDTFTRINRGFETYVPRAGKADRLLAQYDAWLDRADGVSTFAYLHFLEAHWPYKPRRRHMTMFGGDRDTNHFGSFSARDYARLRRAISRGEETLSDDLLVQMIQMYDAAVRRLDGKIKLVLKTLKDRGLLDASLIVVTADHGEEFLEHGMLGHGQSLYDELTHVPLIARIPDGPKGLVLDDPASLTQIPCTLLKAAGLKHALDDVDLLDPSEFAYGELQIRNRYTQVMHGKRWKLHRRIRFNVPPDEDVLGKTPHELFGAYPSTSTLELYDLDADPREQTNLADRDDAASKLNEMVAALDQWWNRCVERCAPTGGQEVPIHDEVIRRIRDLGYIG